MSWSFTSSASTSSSTTPPTCATCPAGSSRCPIVFRGGNGIAHQLGATHSHRDGVGLRPHPGPDRRRPQHAVRRQGSAQDRDPLRRSGDLPRIEKMLNDTRRSPGRRGLHAAARRGRRRAARATDVTIVSYGRPLQRVVPPGGRGTGRRPRHRRRADRPSHAPPARHEDDHRQSIKKTNRCVIVDEDWGYCGMGAGILYKLQKPRLRLPRRPDRVRPQRRDPRAVQPLPRRGDACPASTGSSRR